MRVCKDGAWKRDSIECRPRRRDGSWAGGLGTAFPFTVDPNSQDYIWSNFVQFTHLSHYENGRNPSTGKFVVLFYVKGSKPDSEEELLLKTCKISVVGRDATRKKKVLEPDSLPFPPAPSEFKRPRLGSSIADFARRSPDLDKLPRAKMLATKWFNEVYPERYELCNMITNKPLKEFDEDERASLPQLANFFDKCALVMAEVEFRGEGASEVDRAVFAHMLTTKFSTCAFCTLRANELRSMYNNFQGEWWKEEEINESFRGAHGKKNTVLSKITRRLDNIDEQFDEFEAMKAEFDKVESAEEKPEIIAKASKLDVPGLLITFGRFSLDIITCARMDIDTMIKMKVPLENSPCAECVGDKLGKMKL